MMGNSWSLELAPFALSKLDFVACRLKFKLEDFQKEENLKELTRLSVHARDGSTDN